MKGEERGGVRRKELGGLDKGTRREGKKRAKKDIRSREERRVIKEGRKKIGR